MSIESHPAGKPLVPAPPPTWGEIATEGQTARVVRFTLVDRIVTYPFDHFKRWEHTTGANETLIFFTHDEQIIITGRALSAVRAAFDLGRLCELHPNYSRAAANRAGPRIHGIAIEPR